MQLNKFDARHSRGESIGEINSKPMKSRDIYHSNLMAT